MVKWLFVYILFLAVMQSLAPYTAAAQNSDDGYTDEERAFLKQFNECPEGRRSTEFRDERIVDENTEMLVEKETSQNDKTKRRSRYTKTGQMINVCE